MKTPISTAEQLFNEQQSGKETFLERVLLYLSQGAYVISTPRLFLMFRAVRSAATPEQLVDPQHHFASPDAWYIDMAVGELRLLPQLMPYPLPRICFWRKGRGAIRGYNTMKLFKRIQLCR